jgi:hypothetical protein
MTESGKRRVKVYTSVKGVRYIRLGKKRFNLDVKRNEEYDLIKMLLKAFLAEKRKRKRKRRGPSKSKVDIVPWSSYGVSNVLSSMIQNNDKRIQELTREVKLLEKGTDNPTPPQALRIKESKSNYPELKSYFKKIKKEDVDQIGSDYFGAPKYKYKALSKDELIQLLANSGYTPPKDNVKIEEMKDEKRLAPIIEEEEEEEETEHERKKRRKLEATNSAFIQDLQNLSLDELRDEMINKGRNPKRMSQKQMIDEILKEEFKGEKIPIGDDKFYQIGNGRIGDRGLSNVDIDKIMKPYRKKGYIGCIASDQITDLIPKVHPNMRVGFVMNTEQISQPGQHWLGVYISNREGDKPTVEYFNSLGDKGEDAAPKMFLRRLTPLLDKMKIYDFTLKQNRTPDQKSTTSTCGFFACYFLQKRFNGESFKNASMNNHEGWRQSEIDGENTIDHFRNQLQHGTGVIKYLKKGYHYLKGKLVKIVTDRVTDVLVNGLRKNLPPSARSLLSTHGDEVIQEIVVCRLPIKNVIRRVLDWVSSGTFSQNLKDLGYDNAFHLFMKIRTNKGTYLTEKNEVVKLKEEGWNSGDGAKADTERIGVHVKGGVTLGMLFENAFKKYGEERITRYDSRNNNCQQFVSDLLTASHMMTDDVHKFVMQNAEAIYNGLGILGAVNKGITDVAATVDHVINGRGCVKG